MSKQTVDFSRLAAESQKQALAAIAQAHEAMVKFVQVGLSSLPVETPANWSPPKAKDIVEASYGFASKVLEEQKTFALHLTEITSARVDEARRTVTQAIAAE